MNERKIKHEFSYSNNPFYSTWNTMKERCYLKTYRKYPDYGGRGIKVCDEWLGKDGFKNFCSWSLSYGWHRGLTLDRIDNNGDYSPENCRWVTIEVQNNNKRNNIKVVFWDMEFTVSQLAQFLDVDCDILRNNITDKKLTVNEAVDKSLKSNKRYTPYRKLNKAIAKRNRKKQSIA